MKTASAKFLLLALYYCSCCLHIARGRETSRNSNACGDSSWTPFSDTKCFKLIQQFETWSQAVAVCQAQSPLSTTTDTTNPVTMATIKSAEEQEFVTNFLFGNTELMNNVWLGASRPSNSTANDFVWVDGEKMTEFQNWAEGSGAGNFGKDCVHMESSFRTPPQNDSKDNVIIKGSWRNAGCGRGNWILCEKLQDWDANQVQKILLQIRQDLVRQAKKLVEQDKELEKLRKNPVPVGFLYTELPGHPSPQTIWPSLTWTEVSGSLAGQFFRVVGGEAAAFGSKQSASWSRISRVDTKAGYQSSWGSDLPLSGWSPYTFTGDDGNWDDMSIRFHVEAKENRPINTAVRLWKRSA